MFGSSRTIFISDLMSCKGGGIRYVANSADNLNILIQIAGEGMNYIRIIMMGNGQKFNDYRTKI